MKILLLLMAFLSTALSQSQSLTCKAGSFSRGETASVVCDFHEDVGKSLRHVYVSFSPFDSLNEVEDTEVLVCFKLYDKGRQCRKAIGYNWDNVISSNLTIEIPNVQARFAGRYSCNLVPPGDLQSKPCDLHVEDGIEPSLHLKAIIGVAVSGTLLIAVLVCVAVYRTRLIKKGRSRPPSRTTGIEMPTLQQHAETSDPVEEPLLNKTMEQTLEDKEPRLDKKLEQLLEEIKNLLQQREPRYMYKELYLMDGAQIVVSNTVNTPNSSEAKTILTPDTDRDKPRQIPSIQEEPEESVALTRAVQKIEMELRAMLKEQQMETRAMLKEQQMETPAMLKEQQMETGHTTKPEIFERALQKKGQMAREEPEESVALTRAVQKREMELV